MKTTYSGSSQGKMLHPSKQLVGLEQDFAMDGMYIDYKSMHIFNFSNSLPLGTWNLCGVKMGSKL